MRPRIIEEAARSRKIENGGAQGMGGEGRECDRGTEKEMEGEGRVVDYERRGRDRRDTEGGRQQQEDTIKEHETLYSDPSDWDPLPEVGPEGRGTRFLGEEAELDSPEGFSSI